MSRPLFLFLGGAALKVAIIVFVFRLTCLLRGYCTTRASFEKSF
ncbi:MAG: hypothetical protein ACI9E9_000572 [Reinekea sp.]|jgi:hypothetical protein